MAYAYFFIFIFVVWQGSVSRRISMNWILVTTSLKLFDISSNNFCEYIDLGHNIFEGSFSFSSFSNHIKLQFVRIRSDNDKFKVETEDPIGCIPMFQFLLFPCSYWCNSFSMSSTNITTVACWNNSVNLNYYYYWLI